ncbi:MAG: RNA pseudouridine synthase, partial [Aquabacterium sp.]|nr:RNA pseudouridine synthase [Ferruginibacter sp.]
GFIHPTTKQPILFESDLPDDMVAVISKWRKYSADKNDVS